MMDAILSPAERSFKIFTAFYVTVRLLRAAASWKHARRAAHENIGSSPCTVPGSVHVTEETVEFVRVSFCDFDSSG